MQGAGITRIVVFYTTSSLYSIAALEQTLVHAFCDGFGIRDPPAISCIPVAVLADHVFIAAQMVAVDLVQMEAETWTVV
jgi:hypothetical protein